MNRVGIYVRVSTDMQSTELQEQSLREYCKHRGWGEITVYRDEGKTGTNGNRPALKELMTACRSRSIDIVLCIKLDRLFRSLSGLIATLKEFEDLGVKFVCQKDQIDLTTSSGRLMVQIIAAFAEFESSIIKERVTSGVRAAIEKRGGKWGPQMIDRTKVLSLKNLGLSAVQIAKKLNISRSSVYNCLKAG